MSPKNLSATSKTHKYLFNCLRDQRVLKIYNQFERSFQCNHNFIVAVSGGPDSLALVALTKVYSLFKKTKFYYILVDHKISKNSYQEANKVKKRPIIF